MMLLTDRYYAPGRRVTEPHSSTGVATHEPHGPAASPHRYADAFLFILWRRRLTRVTLSSSDDGDD